MTAVVTSDHLISIMHSARQRSLDLLEGLNDDQLIGPKLPIVNPLIWEIGHVAWFHEYFILRREYDERPMLDRGDSLYDSIAIAHEKRWDLPIYSLQEVKDYMSRLLDRLIQRLPDGIASERDSYLYQFTTFHEDMHDEAFVWARQTLAYPVPNITYEEAEVERKPLTGPLTGDADIPGGTLILGSLPEEPFLFDNEKWGHEVIIAPFKMAKAPVTNAEFAEFVEDGGYSRASLWSRDGWAWRQVQKRDRPASWQSDSSGGWKVRRFDTVTDMEPHQPVVHINWFEANAWCKWADRRLPTEAEWEFAATMQPGDQGTLSRSPYPWGNAPFSPEYAATDMRERGCVDVADYPEGDNPWGVRQLIGNVWEWTADTFAPYPGFSPDDYKEYSEPLFFNTKVLRGGSWVTRNRYMNARYRNYFGPERSDIFSGFRTCAFSNH